MAYLPMQVGDFHPIAVEQTDGAYSSRSEVHGQWTSDTSTADYRYFCFCEFDLSSELDLFQQHLARISFNEVPRQKFRPKVGLQLLVVGLLVMRHHPCCVLLGQFL